MNKYELTVVLPGKTTAAKKKSVTEEVKKAITLLKGEAGAVQDWGVKDLAYKIAKNEQGLFLHIPLELEASSVKQLDTKLKMNDNVIRYLIVKSDK